MTQHEFNRRVTELLIEVAQAAIDHRVNEMTLYNVMALDNALPVDQDND